MAILENGEKLKLNTPLGEPFTIQNNLPLRLKLKTTGGTVIEGIILPNNPLTITPGNDIAACDYYMEEDLLSDELKVIK